MTERDSGIQIESLEQYWRDPIIISKTIQFLGGEGNSWESIDTIKSAYVGVGTLQKLFSGKKSPVSTYLPQDLEASITRHNGNVELFTSFLQKASPEQENLPVRSLFCWDVDQFVIQNDGNYDEGTLIRNPHSTYEKLDPAYGIYRNAFDSYGLPILAVSSGKGFHFFTQVSDSSTLRILQSIGEVVEDTISQKLMYAHLTSKSPSPIPLFNEQIFKGTTRIQQFLNTRVIRKVRKESSLPVEIWDKGFPGSYVNGIALDNTEALSYVSSKLIGIPGSPYFLKPTRNGLVSDRMILQLPLKGEGFNNSWRDIMNERYSFEKTAKYLDLIDCKVPDASEGIARLINDYQQSDLRYLHLAMDRSMGDKPENYNCGYRANNYEEIIKKTREPDLVRHLIKYANPMLYQMRYYVDKFIFQVFESMGGNRYNLDPAPHVAGVLRAIYEDPRFQWGDKWMRHTDANRWARGSVEQALGQMFEED